MATQMLSLYRRPAPVEGELSLPRPPGVFRQFWARHPWWTDSIFAGTFFFPTFLGAFSLYFEPRSSPWLVGAWMLAVAATTAALLVRRYRPWTALFVMWAYAFVVTGSSVVGAELLTGSITAFAIPLSLYSLAVHRSTRDAWLGLAGSAVVGILADLLASTSSNQSGVGSSHAIFVMLLATLIGINVGNRKRYVDALIDRAARLERERNQQAQLAAAAERSRIAREMHDIVSHSLTVMVTLADGSAATVARSPEQSGVAMRRVAETGRHALADMRRMLGVLHDDGSPATATPADLTPQPGTDDVAKLVESFRAAGLPVHFTFSGVALQDPGQGLTIYRIVQESLTNVLRYATDLTRVDVQITSRRDFISVSVEDDGRAAGHGGVAGGADGTERSPGRGLVGMRERVTLYRGKLHYGPRQHGGWRVVASFAPEHGTPGSEEHEEHEDYGDHEKARQTE